VVAERLVGPVSAAARGPLASAVAGGLERLAPWRRGVLAILTYHRVDEPGARPDLLPSLVSATPSAFAEQVADLARHYRPVSLAEVVEAAGDPRRLPPRAVHVTVDDGYADFATRAWPVLRAAQVPVTLFVPTAFPDRHGTGFWWDRLWHALATTARPTLPDRPIGAAPLTDPAECRDAMRRLRSWLKDQPHEALEDEVERLVAELDPPPVHDPSILDWGELRRLAAEGVSIAPHTRHHPLLDRVTLETAVAEIEGSVTDLEREIGPTPRVLAYPSGAHGGDAVEAARRAGMVLAVTTERGGNDLRHADPFRLRRINVGGRARSPLVRAQLVWASTIDARR
jgi:peptidoglycan/xylan/chitin deacetylase (PgdA/CDA1 family)